MLSYCDATNNNCFRVGQKKSFFIQPSVRRTRGFNRYLFYFSPGNFGCGRKPAVLPDRSFVAVILENDIRSTDVSKLRSRISKRYFFLSIKNSCVVMFHFPETNMSTDFQKISCTQCAKWILFRNTYGNRTTISIKLLLKCSFRMSSGLFRVSNIICFPTHLYRTVVQ